MRVNKKMAFGLLLLMLISIGWWRWGMPPASHAQAGPGPESKDKATDAPAVAVEVVKKVARIPAAEYVGHVEAIEDVDIHAQITGTIQTVHFEEGRRVKKGDLLFTIAPEPFKAKEQIAQAAVAQAKANLKSSVADRSYAEQYLKRLKTSDSRGVVQSEMDKAESEVGRARAMEQVYEAQIQQAEAELKQAGIDLGYTTICSPIEGKIGRAEVSRGNYVTPEKILASVVQIDPVRVRFSMGDRDYLDMLKKIEEVGLRAKLKLSNGEVYATAGDLDFINNRMDKQTATMALYLRFKNNDNFLIPDSYVTVLLDPPTGQHGVVVPQEAVMTDQKGEYIYVVGQGNIVEQRYLQLGDQTSDDRIVIAGVLEGETVIVQGLQRVRPGVAVQPTQMNATKNGTKDQKS